MPSRAMGGRDDDASSLRERVKDQIKGGPGKRLWRYFADEKHTNHDPDKVDILVLEEYIEYTTTLMDNHGSPTDPQASHKREMVATSKASAPHAANSGGRSRPRSSKQSPQRSRRATSPDAQTERGGGEHRYPTVTKEEQTIINVLQDFRKEFPFDDECYQYLVSNPNVVIAKVIRDFCPNHARSDYSALLMRFVGKCKHDIRIAAYGETQPYYFNHRPEREAPSNPGEAHKRGRTKRRSPSCSRGRSKDKGRAPIRNYAMRRNDDSRSRSRRASHQRSPTLKPADNPLPKLDRKEEKSPEPAPASHSSPATPCRGEVLDMVRKLQASLGVWMLNGKKIMKTISTLEQRVLEEPLLSNSDDE